MFLLGLLQGLFIPLFHNPRMALSGHLAAVQSGMALIIFGVIWGLLLFAQKWKSLAFVTNIVGMYVVWLGITLSAVVGASRALPIAGAGYTTSAIDETLIQLMVAGGSGLMLLSMSIVVTGL